MHLVAYVLWKLNWIHPFADGNGRTARAVAYVVLSIKLDSLLPGAPTIPEQIAGNKRPYYDALETADKHLVGGNIDVSDLEKMLAAMLSTQLLSAAKEAAGEITKPDGQAFHWSSHHLWKEKSKSKLFCLRLKIFFRQMGWPDARLPRSNLFSAQGENGLLRRWLLAITATPTPISDRARPSGWPRRALGSARPFR